MYAADTAPTQSIWQTAENVPNPMAIITKASIPNEIEESARISGHMTPEIAQAELKKIPPVIPVYLFSRQTALSGCNARGGGSPGRAPPQVARRRKNVWVWDLKVRSGRVL